MRPALRLCVCLALLAILAAMSTCDRESTTVVLTVEHVAGSRVYAIGGDCYHCPDSHLAAHFVDGRKYRVLIHNGDRIADIVSYYGSTPPVGRPAPEEVDHP